MFNSNSLFFISLNFFLIIFFIWEIYLEFYLYVLALIFQAILLSLLTPKILKNIFPLRKNIPLESILWSFIYHISYSFPSAFFCSFFCIIVSMQVSWNFHLHAADHFSKASFESLEYCFFFVFVLYLNNIWCFSAQSVCGYPCCVDDGLLNILSTQRVDWCAQFLAKLETYAALRYNLHSLLPPTPKSSVYSRILFS